MVGREVLEVGEEWEELLEKGDGRKEEGRGKVDSSRRVVCGIVSTGNVTGSDLVNVICVTVDPGRVKRSLRKVFCSSRYRR